MPCAALMNVLELTSKYYDPRKVSFRKGGEYHCAALARGAVTGAKEKGRTGFVFGLKRYV